jgi:universal stress protein A
MKPTIIVPFDFSGTAEEALRWAVDLQKTTGGKPLQMVHAINSIPPGTVETAFALIVPTGDEIAALERTMVEAARRYDTRASAKVVCAPAAVGDIILDAARSGGADLVVMGTHGRTGLKRLILGSVAEHVLRHAHCPVVTVHESGIG